MRTFRAALLAFTAAFALHAQESGIPLDPPDPAHPLEHDAIVRVVWSEAEGTGRIEVDGRKFSKTEDILETVRAKVTADPQLRVVFCLVGNVPFEFGKQVVFTLRQAGVTRLAVAMPEGVTLPVAKDAKATTPPGPQLDIRVGWSAAGDTGTIQIGDQKFTKADEILETLQARVKEKPELRILIRADRTVHYEYLKQVIMVAGKAGAGKVTFSVIDQNPLPKPTP